MPTYARTLRNVLDAGTAPGSRAVTGHDPRPYDGSSAHEKYCRERQAGESEPAKDRNRGATNRAGTTADALCAHPVLIRRH